MVRTVIIPLADPELDPHGIAEQAIVCAHVLADPSSSTIILVSAIDDESDAPRRQAYLDHIAGTIDGVVETVVSMGDPAEVIVNLTKTTVDAMVVMASHGRRGAPLRSLGSVACTVAREAQCPVLILPASILTEAPICRVVRNLVLPLNDSSRAQEIVNAVMAVVVAPQGSTLSFRLIEVTPPIPPRPATVKGETYEGSHEVPAHFLRSIANTLHEQGVTATWDLRIGDPAHELTRYAQETTADLIVMPSHGHHGFNSLIHGVVAEQIELPNPVPVLLIPMPVASLGHSATTARVARR